MAGPSTGEDFASWSMQLKAGCTAAIALLVIVVTYPGLPWWIGVPLMLVVIFGGILAISPNKEDDA